MIVNPIENLITESVRKRESDSIPVPKYMLVAMIHANSLDDLHAAVDQFAIDMEVEWAEREQIDATDGTTTVRMEVTNSVQTPELYEEQLTMWRETHRIGKGSVKA